MGCHTRGRNTLRSGRLPEREVLLSGLVMATLSLSVATAEAVQRIPDANCNGDMHEALAMAKDAKTKYREFEQRQAVKAVA